MWNDLDSPEGRAAFIESHGPDAFNRARRDHLEANVVETVNGYPFVEPSRNASRRCLP